MSKTPFLFGMSSGEYPAQGQFQLVLGTTLRTPTGWQVVATDTQIETVPAAAIGPDTLKINNQAVNTNA